MRVRDTEPYVYRPLVYTYDYLWCQYISNTYCLLNSL